MDAIPLLRTDAAITLMRDIIASGQLNDVTLDNWFASLAFYKNPTRAMVTTVAVSFNILCKTINREQLVCVYQSNLVSINYIVNVL